jgi:ferredoxin
VTRLRLASQWLFGLFFLWLLWETRYAGEDVITTPVNAFFRIDPLAGLSAMAAARTVLPFFWPLLLVVPLTLAFGRLFCGWICPLGGALDLVGAGNTGKAAAPPAPAPGRRRAWYDAKEWLLAALLVSSLFSLNLAGVFDPLSLLIRTLAMGVLPALEGGVRLLFEGAWSLGGPVRAASEPLYRALSGSVLSFQAPVFPLSLLFLALGAALWWAEKRERRFWCRNLCPAGALFGCLSARAPLAPRIAAERCVSCGKCAGVCPMGACEPGPSAFVPPVGGTSADKSAGSPYHIRRRDCSGCGRCLAACPEGCISFGPGRREAGEPGPISLPRRAFLAAAAAGAALPLVSLAGPRETALPADLIRPPGSAPEKAFLARCVRCGECMRVCLTNGLQPTLFEAGVEGLWTPRLSMRRGYCEYNCTLCGQVCPTDAIAQLHPVEKRATRIGLAVIDRNLCTPFVSGEQCLVCEEHCPTPSKAIVFADAVAAGPAGPVVVKQPRVVRELCIGCGICETRCPLQGAAAIRVVRDGEDRARP